MSKRAPILVRGLSVLAAMCLVGAFAIATFYPPLTSLRRLIAQTDQALLEQLQDYVNDAWGAWAWQNLFVAVLGRPAWLVPLALSAILAGLAASVSSLRRSPGRTERRN